MTAKTALKVQKPKAQAAMSFIGVLKRDAKGRPTTLTVPGSEGHRYQVIIWRKTVETSAGIIHKIQTECYQETAVGLIPDKGNSKRPHKEQERLCYHSQAAVTYCIKEAGKRASWCATMADAINLQRLHKEGHIYLVESRQNECGKLFLLVY